MAPITEESPTCNADASVADGTLNAIDPSGTSSDFRESMPNAERRLYRRLGLRWRLRLSSPAIGTVETKTENLSSRGFYCFVETPLVPGEVVDCDITIPHYGSYDRGACLIVCQAEVMRVEAAGSEPGFGVACRILDFSLSRNHGLPSLA